VYLYPGRPKRLLKSKKNKNCHVNKLEGWRLLLELDYHPRRSKKLVLAF
jgi:hypothetical protein